MTPQKSENTGATEGSQVCRDLEDANGPPGHLFRGSPSVLELEARCGYRPGESHRETDPSYGAVLDLDLGPDNRLVVCPDRLQVIHQRKRGEQWRSDSYHATMNYRLREIMQDVCAKT